MANKKINELDTRTGAALTDLSLVGDPTSGTSFKLTLQQISTLMGVPGKFNQPTGTTAQYLRGDGSLATFPTIPSGTVTSVGLTMPSAFAVANSPVTSSGTLAVTGAGTADQYVRGDGQLANFPTNNGGGSSVNYYLNGSVSQGTFGGDTYYEMSKTPIIGAGTNFTRTNAQGNGYIASFITDAGDPALLNIPGGNWNVEFYFQASSGGGNPSFYGELYKVSSANVFTLIASGSTNPEGITNGTAVDQYFTSIPVPQTALLATDRIAIRIFVTPSGRTITLHTEDNNLCEVLTTFSTGLNALNGLTAQVQYFATGTSGTDFAISSATDTHTFNLPTASGTNRGALSSADWTTFSGKVGGSGATGQVAYWNGTGSQTGSNNLFWDAANARLGIKNNTPSAVLDIVGNNVISDATNALKVIGGSTTLKGNYTTNVGNNFVVTNFSNVVGLSVNGASQVFADNMLIGLGTTIVSTGAGYSFGITHDNSGITFSNNAGATRPYFFTIGGSERFRISNTFNSFPNGNLLVGGTTDGGQRLQVYGDAFVSGNLTLSNSGTTQFTFSTAGNFKFDVIGTGNQLLYTSASSGFLIKFPNGSSGTIFNATSAGQTTGITFLISGRIGRGADIFNIATTPQYHTVNQTFATSSLSGTVAFDISNNHAGSIHSGYNVAELFNPNTSLKDIRYIGVNIQPTINQTAGLTSITRGLYVNPTLTAAADWRSIEWSNNSGWGLYGAGTANNYLGGRLGIGTNTPATQLDIRGDVNGGFGAIISNSNNGSSAETFLGFGQTPVSSPFNAMYFGHFSSTYTTNQFRIASSVAIYAGVACTNGFSLAVNNLTGDFKFWTGVTATEKLRIFNNGNVLIQNGGTFTDAGFKLDVNGTARVSGLLRGDADAQLRGVYPFLELRPNGWSGGQTYIQAGLNLIGSNVGDYTLFTTPTNKGYAFYSGSTIPLLIETTTSNIALNASATSGYRLYINRGSSTTGALAVVGGITDFAASTTSYATMQINAGVDPTSPANGNIWFDGTDLKMRIGGVTKTFTLV